MRFLGREGRKREFEDKTKVELKVLLLIFGDPCQKHDCFRNSTFVFVLPSVFQSCFSFPIDQSDLSSLTCVEIEG